MSTAIVRFEGITLHPRVDPTNDWTLTTGEVSAMFGVEPNNVRTARLRHADELVEGKHWLTGGVTICDASEQAKRTPPTVWTKRGVIRLSFFLRSPLARAARDWAEDLVLNVIEQRDHDALLVRLAEVERRLAALEARPAQARLFALPPVQRKPVPVNHGAVVARKAEQRTRAIAAIADGHGASIRQLAMFLNVSWFTAHAIVAKLVKDGTIVAEQDGDNHNAIALRVA